MAERQIGTGQQKFRFEILETGRGKLKAEESYFA